MHRELMAGVNKCEALERWSGSCYL